MLNIIVLILNIICAVLFGWIAYDVRQRAGYWNGTAILDAICCVLWIFNAGLRVLIILA